LTLAATGCDDAATEAGRADAAPDVANELQDATADVFAPTDASMPETSEGGRDASDAEAATPELPAVRYIGRFDVRDPQGPRAGFAATRVIIRFRGTEVRADLTQTDGFSGGPTFFDVVVDGALAPSPLEVPAGTRTFTLASGLADAVHEVELFKRSEAQHGVVQFRSFAFPNGGALLPPPPGKLRRIEVIGNSVMTGHGIEGPGPVCPGGSPSRWFNARKTAAYLAATRVQADLALTAYSGKGLTRNVSAGDTLTLPLLFPRALPDDATSDWRFSRYQPDAVVIGMPNVDAESNDSTLANAYTAFLSTLRSAYPQALIMLVVNAAATDNFPVGLQTRTRLSALAMQQASARNAMGDAKVKWHAMTEYNGNGELSGCDYHPNEALHLQMATELTQWLRTDLGW
jgi:hypothetical protein